ncbi:collagen alpha-2(I) chain-like isoform X2 [Sceloporus undulatus]|uniref:collagen alpha-2(I) chain-like isoform X2 n=1 Tax=Sceloporus undulatus TaxID=8520 RepID=UPI001C4A8774|nr:collagen alpha-2(I) chain-like isoform X2 [Sceloporus undulatus]
MASSSSSSSSFSPSTPGLLYRSAFAEECEALATAFREAGERSRPSPLPPPRLPSTIETERLTPLSAAWASASASFCSFRATPRSPNRTYDESQASSLDGGAGAGGAGLASGSSSKGCSRLDLTFEWEPLPPQHPPPVSSTPAPETMVVAAAAAEEGDAGDPEAASVGGKRPAGKGGLPSSKKRRLSVGGTAAAAPGSSRFPAAKGAPKGLRRNGGKGRQSAGLAAPRSSCGGGPGPRAALAQKQPPVETRSGLTEVHRERKSATSLQPPPHRTQKPSLDGSLACRGVKPQGENKPPGTKLPVPTAGGPNTGKMGTQKHPKEKEPATESAKKQILAKQVSQGTGLKWTQTRGSLTARQVPRAAPGCGPCLQCQELREENQRLAKEVEHLKTLLENCQCRGTSFCVHKSG